MQLTLATSAHASTHIVVMGVLCNRALAFSVQSLPNSLARLKITLATFRLPILILFLARGNY